MSKTDYDDLMIKMAPVIFDESQSWIGQHAPGDALYLIPTGRGLYALQARKSGETTSDDAIWIADTGAIELRIDDVEPLRRWIERVLTENPGCMRSRSAAREAFERYTLADADVPTLVETKDYFDADMELDFLVNRILDDAYHDGVRLHGGETAIRALLLEELQRPDEPR